MADSGKGSGNILSILGALGSVAGPLIFGPDFQGDLGAPFKAGAEYLQQKKLQSTLGDIFASTPHTAPLLGVADHLDKNGGLLNLASSEISQLPVNPTDTNLLDTLSGFKSQGQPSLGDQASQFTVDPSLSQVQLPATTAPTAPTTPAQVSQNITQPASSSGDGFSALINRLSQPENFSKLAKVAPDEALGLLARTASQQKDPMQQILAALGIEQKMGSIPGTPQYEAKQKEEQNKFEKEKTFLQGLAQQGFQANREAEAQVKRENWAPKEDEQFNTLNNNIDTAYNVLNRVKSGLAPNMLTAIASTSSVGQALLGRLAPEQIQTLQLVRDLKKNVMNTVKTQSGVQYGMKELEWIRSSMPTEFSSQKDLVNGLQDEILKSRWAMLNDIASKVQKAGNLKPAEDRGFTGDQLRSFLELKKQFQSGNPGNIFTNKDNQQLLSTLGMDIKLQK